MVTGVFLLLVGCNKNETETSSDNLPNNETHLKQASEKKEVENTAKKGDKQATQIAPKTPKPPTPSPSGFVLKEIPVEQKEAKVPKHIAEVNSEFREILKTSNSPALDAWNKYYQIATAEASGAEVVQTDELWGELLKKISTKRIPNSFYQEKAGANIELQKSLYGLYLASHLSSSAGGDQLFKFIENRAGDETVKQIDLDLFKIIVAGMNQAEGSLDKMNFDQWQKLSKLENPVYKMLAIQVGRRLSQEGRVGIGSPDELNQKRLNYYKSFLNDKSQKLRLEALKSIRGLGEDLASPVLAAYRKGTYGEADQAEIGEIFKQ